MGEMKTVSWVVTWAASPMMHLTTEMWAEEQTCGEERVTSAIDKLCRSKESPGGMPSRPLEIIRRCPGLERGFRSHWWWDGNGGPRKRSPECVRAGVLELGLWRSVPELLEIICTTLCVGRNKRTFFWGKSKSIAFIEFSEKSQ